MSRFRTRGGSSVTEFLGNQITDVYGSVITADITHTAVHLHEKCTDEIHPRYPREGGPLDLSRYAVEFADGNGWHGTKRVLTDYNMSNYYSGLYRASHSAGSLPNPDNSCASYGATAWDRFKPAGPDVSLSVFFAELTSIKDLIFKRLNSFRNLGNNYLAVEFGWKPTLRDIRDWYESLRALDARVAQLQRDNGRWIRRGGTVKKDVDSGDIGITPYGQISPDDPNSRNHWATRKWRSEERVWFSGAFRYYIPGLNSQKWGKLRAIQELWDLKLTPEQVYQLIPFSWLVDWFSNLGSVVSNLQSSIDDHLVAKYAYVMRSKEHTTETVVGQDLYQRVQETPTSSFTVTYRPIQCRSTVTTVTKARAVADPFGFSVTLPDFTAWQQSILLALGLGFTKR